MKTGTKVAGTVALVGGLVGGALLLNEPRTRMFPTLPCSPEVGWDANQTWAPFSGSQAPSKNPDTGYRISGVKVEQGQLRPAAGGGTEIVQARTPTQANPENAEWVPFNPTNTNHCNTASLFSSYGMNWSHGPVHGLHDDCAGYYQQVHGKMPTDMEWKDCDYNMGIFLDWKEQACRVTPNGVWDRPTGTCRTDGTSCGDTICQPQYLETSRNCKVDCGAAPPPTSCVASATRLCLQQARFAVDVKWSTQGNTGNGTTIPMTADTGGFWFFASTNYELLVKVLDGRGVNGSYWVFYGALSDVEYTITVTDTKTGAKKVYSNSQGTMASKSDVNAFPSN